MPLSSFYVKRYELLIYCWFSLHEHQWRWYHPKENVFNRNRTQNLLSDSWAYANTHFNLAQLSELYFHQQLPATFIISQRGHKASSEEVFIITLTKIASGKTNVDLTELFGATTGTFIGRVYSIFLEALENKADGIIYGNFLQRWVHLFPAFFDVIKNKLNRPQCGELLFESVRIIGFLDCKIDEACIPGTGPISNDELAERRPDAEYLQRVVYSGYLKCHSLKVLTTYCGIPEWDYILSLWSSIC